jgi:glycosyltransferase involved in cell wall biosynthesis
MNKDTILVVMPIYNAEKTLGAAIESILNQTYNNISLILVDDASTDSSLEIAKSYTHDNRVTVYHNKENRGAYYSRNLGLYFNQKNPWGFFTTHDADDVSFPDRFESLLQIIKKPGVNAVQDIFQRVDYRTKKTISKKLTIAHALFRRSVFDAIGYFEVVRFGADWEHWARLTEYNKFNDLTTQSYNRVVGKSYVLDTNLTVQIPINSPLRKQYILESKNQHLLMNETGDFYFYFSPDKNIGEKVIYKAKKIINQIVEADQTMPPKINKSSRVAVVVLTWQRISALRNTLYSLYRQTHKNFDVYISNGNLNPKTCAIIEKYATSYRLRGMNIYVSHDGNEIFAFRRMTVGKRLAENGYEIILFIDDDVTIPSKYVSRCLDQYEPKTYKSGFAWSLFKEGSSYYKYRERRWDNEKQINYCGTGISMIDASIFLEKGLLDAPESAYKIEDLWLSYYAQHVMKWRLAYMATPEVLISGDDNVALFKSVQKDLINKDHLLRELVSRGWKIPK